MADNQKLFNLVSLIGLGIAINSAGIIFANAQTINGKILRPINAGDAPQISGAVTINGQNIAAMRQTLQVKRQYDFANLRQAPQVQLGEATLNFKPVLQNPKSVFNVAQRLREMPQAATVLSDQTELLEVDKGMLLHSSVTYRIIPGACASPSTSSGLRASGAGCFNKINPNTAAQIFSDPTDPHYVARDADRVKALANYQAVSTQQSADLDARVSQIQAALKNPAQRAALINKIGVAEVARIEMLSGEDLKGDIINSGQVSIEQVMYIPKFESVAKLSSVGSFAPTANASAIDAAHPKAKSELNDNIAPQVTNTFVTPTITKTEDLGPFIYLTGFTLGREYEWRTRAEYTIDPCHYIPFVDNCPTTYFIEPYANLNYGFGLRFPIEVRMHYSYPAIADSSRYANLNIKYLPINGSPAQYAASGLDNSQIFSGKELVAQYGATVGFAYKVPFSSNDFSLSISNDFTEGLPAPFTNGQFTPPEPGTPGLNVFERVFKELDLLGGYGNYGVAGVRVFPAVRVDLHSDSLRFTLYDNIDGKVSNVAKSDSNYRVGVSMNGLSKVTLANPVYNLGFLVTPGLDANAFIDVSIWSHNWDWLVWFPEIALELPPGGIDFACHAETQCARSFEIRAHDPLVKQNNAPTAIGAAGIEKPNVTIQNQNPPPASDNGSAVKPINRAIKIPCPQCAVKPN